MRLRPATLLLLLLAASTAAKAAGQGGAPLEASRKALQELQADQAAKPDAKAVGKKLTEGLPQLQTPLPGVTALELVQPGTRRDNEKERKKKKDGQANWLIDGVGKLERDARETGRTRRDSTQDLTEDDEDKPDSSDPDYLLQLYAQQKKEADEKAGARLSTKARPDPIAPFLQEWLGNSPVRGKFFDEYARKSEAGPAPVSPAGPTDTGSSQTLGYPLTGEHRRVATPAQPEPNPYLAGTDLSSRSESGARGIEQPPAGAMSFGVPAGLPPEPVTGPNPAHRPAEKKQPLLAPLDNEKYFPQQKKF